MRKTSNRVAIALITMGVGLGIGNTPEAQASTLELSCRSHQSMPTVTARRTQPAGSKPKAATDPNLDVPMLSFTSEYFTPEQAKHNCKTTAEKLQTLYREGNSKYLASDIVGDRPTVCVVTRRGVGCDSPQAELLFAFDPTVDPSQALYDMLGSNFKQPQRPDSRTIGRIYTSIDSTCECWPF